MGLENEMPLSVTAESRVAPPNIEKEMIVIAPMGMRR